jgi:hypothetical protein
MYKTLQNIKRWSNKHLLVPFNGHVLLAWGLAVDVSPASHNTII